MCLIVDANVAPEFFCTQEPKTDDLRKAVFSGGCCVVYGGHLAIEYSRIEKAKAIILALDRAGKARAVAGDPLFARTKELKASGAVKSNDPHIIALAQISGSRLLHSRDVALHEDFTNKE